MKIPFWGIASIVVSMVLIAGTALATRTNIECPKQLTYTLTADDPNLPDGMFTNTTQTVKKKYTVRSHLRTHEDWPNLLRPGEVRVGCEYRASQGAQATAIYIKSRDVFRFCRKVGGAQSNRWVCER